MDRGKIKAELLVVEHITQENIINIMLKSENEWRAIRDMVDLYNENKRTRRETKKQRPTMK